MSTAPIAWNEITVKRPRPIHRQWLHVLYAILFICFTSTPFMGGQTSARIFLAIWKPVFGTWQADKLLAIHLMIRKTGHFFGYGTVGLIFRNAWYHTARTFSLVVKSWLNPFAGLLAVASTFIVSSLDEIHQMFVPGRVGCLRDALIDTAGALFLNLIVLLLVARRQRNRRRKLAYQE